MDVFRNSPPVSRTFAASVFVISMLVVVRAVDPYRLAFEWPFVLKRFPEIWRFFTSFMFTTKISIILIPYTIWNLGGALERDCIRLRSASLLVYLLFVGFFIIVVNNYVWGSIFFISPMVLAIIWTYAQNNRGAVTNVMGINIPNQYLPAASLFLTLILSGPETMFMEATGIPAAHLWEFLTHYWPTYGGGINLVPTPGFLINWFHGDEARSQQKKVYGSSSRPAAEPANSAFTTGNSWGQRGQGRRLGGE